ncbi:probable leucine-rich repeat receptor-like protein kinase IMK3 [Mangifera indica]|uniref:probable leucine-rich repeat receptor-like protein kinase IMK3 n=1 Tax=Mangifera indica TaxID=29780 RepID=UPI001CFAA701|nr:probable leucine-rich repeat receptor-like protein kinase IMK3 [Mangifera indica]
MGEGVTDKVWEVTKIYCHSTTSRGLVLLILRIDWPSRMKIIRGTARGLQYLHNQENIIHGNLTSSNVLLDEYTNAKIADCGLSRSMIAAANVNVIATAGTFAYRAPELAKLKKANTKTDVYSLGVIMLELLTGKSPGDKMNDVDLPQWVASIIKVEWTNEVSDLELMGDASIIGDELLNTLKLALHCVDPSPSVRPEVQQVLQQLELTCWKKDLSSRFCYKYNLY